MNTTNIGGQAIHHDEAYAAALADGVKSSGQNQHGAKLYSGVSEKLEVGQLQRQYTRGGKRSSGQIIQRQQQHQKQIGEKSVGMIPLDDEDELS